ncbi:MAG: NUDIX hydrolase [Candidatus Aureabacteria bacterium]|nr:NUDIX hydrolase [Candidatus Auribacterota bacterium]
MDTRMKNIFKGRLIRLSVRRQKLPGGHVADLEVIEHPGAVLIVPVMADGRVILIRQYRPVIRSYIWELPAGTLEPGEKPLVCAKRELVEEVGYAARSWIKAGFIYPAPGYTTEKIHLFVAHGLHGVGSRPESDEIIRPRAFTPRSVKKLMRSGKLVDAKTICALAIAGML